MSGCSAHQDAGGSAGLGSANDSAEVAWILHIDGDHEEAICATIYCPGVGWTPAGNRHDSGRSADRAHRFEGLVVDGVHGRAAPFEAQRVYPVTD